MPLTYNGTTIGKVVIEQERDGEKLRFPIQIRQGNCLAVLIFVRKSTPEELAKNPKGKWYHMLYTFFCDEQHCKNIMKDYGELLCGEKVVSAELNLYYKENYTLLKYFVKSGYKVKCFYKQPKKK